MSWLLELIWGESIAHAILILALVAGTGLALGHLRVAGIGLGIAGVLFTGLLFGHFGLGINAEVLDFAREFGLILFVYSIGIQVGPGFFDSLRRQGLPLNLMAAGIILGGVVVTLLIHFLAGIETPIAVGLFSGATTNTPSLAAAQQALRDVPGFTTEMAKLPGLGYAVAYPFGVIGIILTMLLVRSAFRIDLMRETEALKEEQAAGGRASLARMHLEVKNPGVDGQRVREVLAQLGSEAGVVISRILHGGEIQVALPDTRIHQGDVILAVGPRDRLEALRDLVGTESPIDLTSIESEITATRIIVTRKDIVGKSVAELDLPERHGVTITRVTRAGVEFSPGPAVRLQLGDSLLAVGPRDAIERAGRELGNSARELGVPEIIPIFTGIALGILLGSWPIPVPGVPAPVKLGLAGGPLVVAILLSRVGHIGPLFWYLPQSANLVLREIGIVLFLAAVGLRAGDRFVETLVSGDGFVWMGLAALITLVPLLVVALIGRLFLKVNYLTLCGLLSGSMTDPPALAFAGSFTRSEAPSVAYATVYPLTMILRVLSAQLMVLLLMR